LEEAAVLSRHLLQGTEDFHSFPQSLKGNAGIEAPLSHDRSHPNLFQLIAHLPLYHLMLYSFDIKNGRKIMD
jgi:hypothetical protein